MHFRVDALFHSTVSASRSAAASAPTKFGIRPSTPGKRETPAALIPDHALSLRVCLSTRATICERIGRE